ncbi:dephospho-CoA kinase [bacterium]|nr:dephospho-CoA kinase [bacterium]
MKKKPPKFFVLGITGPIGSGKSTLGEILASAGIPNIEVDQIGHQVLQNFSIQQALIKEFGTSILLSDQNIDRKALGKIVFSNSTSMEALNEIVHPPMIKLVVERISKEKAQGAKAVALIAALLYSMKLNKYCNKIVYMRASPHARLSRIVASRGLSQEAARARLLAQDPEPNKGPKVIFCENTQTIDALSSWAKFNLPLLFKD